jgi:hypothetical protein
MNFRLGAKILFIAAILIGGCLVVRVAVFSATSQDLDVSLQVTTTTEPEVPEEPGGGGTLPDTTSPVISDVTSTVNFTTSTVSWTAVDESTIQSCSFYYGETTAYGSSATVENSLSTYHVDLSGLTEGTDYYFLISCLDSSGNPGSATGFFSTLSSAFQNSLIIIAKQEKRVPKTGGNYDMDAFLLLYNPTTEALVYSRALTFDGTGSTTLTDASIPTGNYDAVIKGETHLAKRIINVDIVNGVDVTLDFTLSNTFYLYTGDVQGTGLKDNFVDILDVSKENVEFGSGVKVFDLNRDGAADVLDISAVLTNFNMSGDAI